VRNSIGELLDIAYHDGQRDDVLVILGHGVTGNKDRPMLFWLARALADHGYPSIRLSWSGNGDSEGKFTESNITKEVGDLTAVIDQLGAGKKIIYIGHSMGGAVGTLTAARDERIKLLVSLAGMVYTKEFCEREFGDVTPDRGVMWDEEEFPLSQSYVDDLHQIDNTLGAAGELRVPWLLFHGLADDVVFPKDSQDLHAVLRGPKKLVEIADAEHSFEGHYDCLCHETIAWLDQHIPS
ncbi:MAG: lysophospholipase, partial [Verrucomicrobiae bacterium]|nr:lysophospholipase [Verrucomicrobiae bacterium]NNJ87293.1 alpha/beta fold hydrolase [Akkermansiaceae bacterium]